MRWFVTGSEGQLGSALRQCLSAAGETFFGKDLELDIADTGAVRRELDGLPGGPPDLLVNAAALTHVDRCQTEPELARRINAEAPVGLARLCREIGIGFVHISTDYVFDGAARSPYPVDAEARPASVYGETKWEGERDVRSVCPDALVVRTSWVFGRGRNFVAAVLEQADRVARGGEGQLRVVDDQRGRPTYAADLAEALRLLVEGRQTGVFHVANEGEATWWDLARAALDQAGHEDLPIERIDTRSLDLPAPRPHYSVLDLSKARAAGVPMRPWQQALRAYLDSADSPLDRAA